MNIFQMYIGNHTHLQVHRLYAFFRQGNMEELVVVLVDHGSEINLMSKKFISNLEGNGN
jgi:hypothetical protein